MFLFKKDFWRYFWNTYKNAKWLVLRYIIVAIYLTVSSLFVNSMQLYDLTYFNAVVSVGVFCEIFGFGISNGVGVYINQNIKNKEKAANYVKIGSYLNSLIAVVFVVILFVYKNFILHQLLGLPTDINYTFYYAMLVYVFFNCILNYTVHILKTLKVFIAEMLTSLLQCTLVITGYFIVASKCGLALEIIPFIYITASLICMLFSFVCLYKNKELSVNMLKFTKFVINKKELSIILYMTSMQIVWQIGYLMLSLFLLKVSEILFNQYVYFENILNIFNGLFFSFIAMTSIEICRNLGEEKYDEAYSHAKYSLYSTVVIWLVYFVVSMLLITPIKSGMNINLQSTATVAMMLYVGMHIFRYLMWDLSTYILCWGGKVKLQFWLEVISTLYFIILYFIANYIPNNIYLIYLLIILDNIIKLPIEISIFKKRKWLRNINAVNE